MIQEPAAHLLEHWKEFYLLVGTAAAALVALLFVAASLGVGILAKHSDGPTRTYMSPVAFHFTSALFVSAAALVPTHTRFSLGVLVALNAVAGTIYAAFVLRRLFTDNIADLAVRLCGGPRRCLAYFSQFGARRRFPRRYSRAVARGEYPQRLGLATVDGPAAW